MKNEPSTTILYYIGESHVTKLIPESRKKKFEQFVRFARDSGSSRIVAITTIRAHVMRANTHRYWKILGHARRLCRAHGLSVVGGANDGGGRSLVDAYS